LSACFSLPTTMKNNWRKWFHIIHRDLGYFFVVMTIIYALSGIAVNHINDWNPNYIIESETAKVQVLNDRNAIDKETVLDILAKFGEKENYKKHYFPSSDKMKIFFDGGTAVVDLQTGETVTETIRRRPVFHLVNYLHYNPGKWWLWFSDFYAVSLIILAITGLFLIKGKKGFKWRGAIIAALGLILPLLFVLLYY